MSFQVSQFHGGLIKVWWDPACFLCGSFHDIDFHPQSSSCESGKVAFYGPTLAQCPLHRSPAHSTEAPPTPQMPCPSQFLVLPLAFKALVSQP